MVLTLIQTLIDTVSFITGIFMKVLNLAFVTAATLLMWIGIVMLTFFTYQLVVKKSFNTYENMVNYKNLPAFVVADAEPDEAEIYAAPIRLHLPNGSFFCSATVISDRYALTAAHCLVSASQPSDLKFGTSLRKDKFIIKDKTGTDTGIKATVAGVKISQDVGLVIGDFRKFKKNNVDFKPSGLLSHNGPFYTCGFPGGDGYICIPFKPQGSVSFLIVGTGYLYKGMSGGPVIDTETNEIVAVNSRVLGSGVAVSPLVGLLPGLGIEVK